MTGRQPGRRWLWPILVAYLILAVATGLIVPLGESPDEVDHFGFVDLLVRENRLPVMSPIKEENVTLEANQPPLYYAIAALTSGWVAWEEAFERPFVDCFSFEPDDLGRQHLYLHDPVEQWPYAGVILGFHLARLVSTLLGAATVWLAFEVGRLISPGRRAVAPLAAALVAFNPQFIFISASVNNDALTATLGAAIVALSLRLIRPELAPRKLHTSWILPALIILLGLAALTKLALLAVFPIPVAAVLINSFLSSTHPQTIQFTAHGARVAARNLLLLLGPLPFIAGWWYGRNLQLYGDLLAWDVHLAAKGADVLRTTPLALADLAEFASLHARSFWGLFGWLNVQLPPALYIPLFFLTGVGAVGAGLVLFERVGGRGSWRTSGFLTVFLTALSVAGVYAALIRYIGTINWSGYQGRLAFTIIAPLGALLALGLNRLLPRVLLLLTGGSVLLIALWAVGHTLPQAYPRPAIYTPPTTAQQVCLRGDGQFIVEALDLPDSGRPGAPVTGAVYTWGMASGQGVLLTATLTGWEGAEIGRTSVPLSWTQGNVTTLPLTVTLPADAAPSRAWLHLNLTRPDGSPVTLTGLGGEPLAQPATVAALKIAQPLSPSADVQVEVGRTFGREITLLGYDLALSNDEAELRLLWQAETTPSFDYTIFIQARDATGAIVAQADGQPLAGQYPTGIWSPGERVADQRVVAGIEAAESLAVGIYRLDTGERLTLPDGADTIFIPLQQP